MKIVLDIYIKKIIIQYIYIKIKREWSIQSIRIN